MAYFNPKTGYIELNHDDREPLYRPKTPYFISHFWDWIASGKPLTIQEPEIKHVDITK